MGKNIFETLMGAVVLLVALGFVVVAYSSASVNTVEGYQLVARFDRVDGLKIGSDVRVSGLKVGTVAEQTIDPKTYLAVVKLTIEDEVKLPKDSSAEIVSDGLLGGKYIALVPGAEEEMFKNSDEIMITQSAVSIEQLIGKFMFGGSEKDGQKEGGNTTETAPSTSGGAVPGASNATTPKKNPEDIF